MRVFHLIKSLGRGGAETLLLGALRDAEALGIETRVGYFLPWKDALVGSMREGGAEVVCFGATTRAAMFAQARRVAREVRVWRADVIHCHMPLAGVLGRLVGRLARTPVVYTEHNLFERYHPLTRLAERATWRMQDAVIAVSPQVEESIRHNLGLGVPVHLVRNGVRVQDFDATADPGVRARWEIAADAPVVGTVAVFRAQKQLDDWLRAARSIADAEPRARFLIVGEGPLREELERLTRALGLDTRVIFTGLQSDVRPLLSAMDVFMMSSVFEGLPVALLEAMAMERAVVATRVGGIPDVVVDSAEGETGVLVPARDPAALARAALALLVDPARRRAMGQAGRARVQERFSISRMVRELSTIYERAMRAHA